MDIIINRAIVHELIKDKGEEPEPLNYRPTLLPTDNQSVRGVIAGVVGIYGRKNNSARYGVFGTEHAYRVVPDTFDNYAQLDDINDADFIGLSRTVMEQLHREAAGVPFATGGHILFADYESDGNNFFLAAMIKQKSGFTFSDTLGVEDLEYIDLSKLHQAIKINIDSYLDYQQIDDDLERQERTYLSFVSPQASSETAGYFIKAMGCKAGAASAKATEAAITQSVMFFQERGELREHSASLKRSLCTYLQNQADNKQSATLADIEGIARRFFPTDDEEQADQYADDFITHLNREESGVPPEFSVNKSKLKSITHVVFKGDDLHLEFDKGDLGRDVNARVYFDGNRVIIKELPQALIDKLNQQLDGD